MQSKALSLFAILAVLGFAAYWFVGTQDTDPIPDPNPIEDVGDPGDDPAKDLAGARTSSKKDESDEGIVRKKFDYEIPSGAKAEQGVAGLILNPEGSPVVGATVYLIRGVGVDSLSILLRYKKGDRFPPVAMATSDENGRFRIGLRDWKDETTYEVRILHDEYADQRIERIRPQPMDWWDCGSVTLKRGATIHGAVYSEDGAGISDATVTARPQFTHGMLSVPGREDGIEIKTDESGNFELRNIDPLDFAGLSAHAPGHTRSEKTELQLAEGSRLQIDFQLGKGYEISGIIVDPHGKPIRGASVTCAALSQKSPQEEKTYTDSDGMFLAESLRGGMFNVIVEADGYQRAEEQPVKAGARDLKITVEKLGSVYVTAFGRNRVPLSSFLCNIKSAAVGQTTYGKPMLTKDVAGAKDGTALISGLRPFTYVAEVSARGYAKNFSARFTIVEGQTDPVAVEVELNEGGTMRGVVTDEGGQPIQGVTISTMPHDLIENPLIDAFGGAPYTITRATRKTDKRGAFEFKLLHPGEDQLKFVHPDYCTVFTKKNMAEVGRQSDLPDVKLPRGCEVSGLARLEGKATGQVKVHISAIAKKDQPSSFTTEATTDNEGRFLMPKRVPPGQDEYRAAQMGLGPFMIMIQFQKKTPFTVGPGREDMQLLVDVPPIKK